jgi:[ribosomal protein S5]-alanine N-acetyltransferase
MAGSIPAWHRAIGDAMSKYINQQMASYQFFPFPVLITENLLLRQLSTDDAPEIFALRSNEQVNRYIDRNKAESLDDALTFIDLINKSIANNESIYWVLQLKNDFKVIGTICLWNLSQEDGKAEIGYELLPAFQGKGLMQEAMSGIIEYGFNVMQLQTIEAWTVMQNQASIRTLQNNGFVVDEKAIGKMTEEEKKKGIIVFILTAPNKTVDLIPN